LEDKNIACQSCSLACCHGNSSPKIKESIYSQGRAGLQTIGVSAIEASKDITAGSKEL
jgi:hypothetical protein